MKEKGMAGEGIGGEGGNSAGTAAGEQLKMKSGRKEWMDG